MRVRWSKHVALLTKAGFFLSVLWLFYLFVFRSSNTAPAENGSKHSIESRVAFTAVEVDAETLKRAIYVKPPPDSNAHGEWGRATRLNLNSEEKKQEEDSIERYAINIYVSDKISLHRHIEDNRMHEWVDLPPLWIKFFCQTLDQLSSINSMTWGILFLLNTSN